MTERGLQTRKKLLTGKAWNSDVNYLFDIESNLASHKAKEMSEEISGRLYDARNWPSPVQDKDFVIPIASRFVSRLIPRGRARTVMLWTCRRACRPPSGSASGDRQRCFVYEIGSTVHAGAFWSEPWRVLSYNVD